MGCLAYGPAAPMPNFVFEMQISPEASRRFQKSLNEARRILRDRPRPPARKTNSGIDGTLIGFLAGRLT